VTLKVPELLFALPMTGTPLTRLWELVEVEVSPVSPLSPGSPVIPKAGFCAVARLMDTPDFPGETLVVCPDPPLTTETPGSRGEACTAADNGWLPTVALLLV
jgi:hypothetical protein